VKREGAPTVDADAIVVERRLRGGLGDREVHVLRQHEGRVVIDGILLVSLREQEDARLPAQREAAPERDRRILPGRQPSFLRELQILLGVGARDERQRRVVEVGAVIGLPPHQAGDGGEIHGLSRVTQRQRGSDDVTMGEAFEIALHVKRLGANGVQVVQSVVPVSRALGRDNRASFPARTWREEQLALAEERRAGVDVVAGHDVRREPVTR
jgi:hypothetical protein